MTLTKIFNKYLLKACGTHNILVDPKEAGDEIHTPEDLWGDQKNNKITSMKEPEDQSLVIYGRVVCSSSRRPHGLLPHLFQLLPKCHFRSEKVPNHSIHKLHQPPHKPCLSPPALFGFSPSPFSLYNFVIYLTTPPTYKCNHKSRDTLHFVHCWIPSR